MFLIRSYLGCWVVESGVCCGVVLLGALVVLSAEPLGEVVVVVVLWVVVVLASPLFVVDEPLEELSGCAELFVVIPVEELEPEAGAAPV